MNLYRQSAGLLVGGDLRYHKTAICTGQHNTEEERTDTRASSGIRMHDSSVRAAEDISLITNVN
jgi:hypothetical protein